MFKKLLQKIKQILGIGGVKIEVEVPSTEISKEAGEVSGKILMAAKSDQLVQELKVELIEEYTTGRGENKETKEFTLGEVVVAEGIEMKAGEEKSLEFKCAFTLLKSKNDLRAESGSKATAAVGKIGKFMDAEKSEYSIKATGDVKGTLVSPSGEVEITLV